MLSDTEIIKHISSGEITVRPFNRANLGANSYDLTIAPKVKFLQYSDSPVDLSKPCTDYVEWKLPQIICPKDVMVFTTKETVGCDTRMLGILSPRSNLARSGLIFQFSALVDSGFDGVLSGMAINATSRRIRVPKNLRVMQIMFMRVDGSVWQPYKKRYSSKNIKQTDIGQVHYKADKEFEEVK